MEDKGQILLYQTPDGESRIEVRLEGETVWLNQEQMAELYGKTRSAQLFDLVKIEKKEGVDYPRKFEDYEVTIDKANLPKGVTIEEMI